MGVKTLKYTNTFVVVQPSSSDHQLRYDVHNLMWSVRCLEAIANAKKTMVHINLYAIFLKLNSMMFPTFGTTQNVWES